jgi:hypothetical protein
MKKNYYDRKRVSASLIKNLHSGMNFNEAIAKLESSETSDAMKEGTAIHSYLLEGAEPSGIHKERYGIYKPFFDGLGGEREKEFYFEFEGVKCKSKIDLINNEVWDLKTTSNIRSVYETIEKFNYNLQLEFYRIATGLKCNFIFVDKNKRANLQVIRHQPSKANLNIIKDIIFNYYKEIKEWQE